MNYSSASLYVGDLHEEISEALLFDLFHEVGPIISIRICRDAMTRKSLGYAYVNFQNPQDAERALDTLNYASVKGIPIRIMWSQRDPSIRKSGIGNIFIKNLDKSIDNKALYDTFSAFGNILSCKVCQATKKGDNGGDNVESAGYGFVHFETQEAAEKAIAKINGMLLNGKQVFVGPFVKKTERLKILSNEDSFTNIYVKNLDASVDEKELSETFSKFGEIQNAVVMRGENGASKEFGFINFADHASALIAIDEMNEKEFKNKKLFVGRAQKKNERRAKLKEYFQKLKQEKVNKYKGLNLYVKNLDDSIDDERLRQEFSKFGEITSAKVMSDNKQSRGFGFVCFKTPEAANKALTEMTGHMIGSKPLYVNFAQPKELRRSQLEAQYNARKQPQMIPQMMPQFFIPAQGAFPPPGSQIKPRWQPVAGGRQSNNSRGGMTRGGSSQRGTSRGGNTNAAKNAGRIKYNNNARNQPREQPQQTTPNTQEAQTTQAPSDQLTAEYLAKLSEQDQKQLLGERLFPLVHLREPKNAPKITGMLLDMEVSDILTLIESTDALNQKIKEAVKVLVEHGQNDQ